ncbi:Tat pathway signal sequence protein [Rutstroemia sp. NJR-2017a WRK4]|nr:Tat pathway signal sequence protein [Rutstroemia sp. NJR-2017a WRK4]
MIYNKTFTLSPSPESNAAWDSMFPSKYKCVGFVKHPQISPQFSGVAVFHELHCVNILRIGYYAALDGSLEDMQHVHDHNKRPDPHHLRHCFDYLRQALMCAADTNLEPVDLELGGVTGWRFERKCRDFEAVKKWAEANRHWPGELSE